MLMTESIIHLFLWAKNMKVFEKIRIVRQTKEYSQEYMAEKLKIDTANYGRIERGQTKLTIDKLQTIAQILNVPPILFFYENEINHIEFEQKLFEALKSNNNLLQIIIDKLNEINNKLE